jgi:hypothetical protein
LKTDSRICLTKKELNKIHEQTKNLYLKLNQMNISGELEKLKEQIENELEKCFANFENVNNLKHEMILKSFIEKSVVKYKNHMDKNVRT